MYIDFFVSIILLFIIYTNFSLIGCFALSIFKIDLDFRYSFFLGHVIFIIIIIFFYNFLKLDIIYIFILFCVIFFILFFKFYPKNSKLLLKIFKTFFIFYLPVILLFFFIALIYKENFYVFRGNQWDLFAQISRGLIFSENNIIKLDQLIINEISSLKISNQAIGQPYSKSYYFYLVGLFDQRELQGLYLALLYNLKSIDIFILTYALKVFFYIKYSNFILFVNK